jgi:hypothetical protein
MGVGCALCVCARVRDALLIGVQAIGGGGSGVLRRERCCCVRACCLGRRRGGVRVRRGGVAG